MGSVKRKAEERLGDGTKWVRGGKVGRGTFGSVFFGKVRSDHEMNCTWPKTIALKSAKKSESQSLVHEKEVFEDLMRQGSCPYIIDYYGDETTTADKGDDVYNLVLEAATFRSLREYTEHEERLPESHVSIYTRNILEAVKHIHDCGYVHCDLKPDNILIVEIPDQDDDRTLTLVAKVADLGFAKKKNTNYSERRGTWIYLSPEALRENHQEQPSDIWAIGCIVLQMLTGCKLRDVSIVGFFNWFCDWFRESLRSNDPKVRVSGHARDFLGHCFDEDPKERLTAEKLLTHPFVKYSEETVQMQLPAPQSQLITMCSNGDFSIYDT